MRAFVIAGVAGGAIGFFLPSQAMLGASAELIAFVTLIMAGLIPAMILTATALRGDSFSSARVREYGEGLRRQLRFWAVLFLFALVSVLTICLAKILAQTGSLALFSGRLSVPTQPLVSLALSIGFGALSIVIARLYPSYRGLRSLLELTIKMAEAQALTNDRSLSDALDAKAVRLASQMKSPEPASWE